MRIPRVYLPSDLTPGTYVELDSISAHHVRNVLRLKQGDTLKLFNGQACEYGAVLKLVSKKSVALEVGDSLPCDTESGLDIHLGLGISRGERMDFAIQKAVELGVTRISPLFTDRCVVKLDQKRSPLKQRHWQSIARNAAEQSGRTRVPDVENPRKMTYWLEECQGLKILLDPFADQSLSTLSPPSRNVHLLSGPEGGFSGQEREIAIQAGFMGIRLGPRILRAETAVLTGISLIQARWGDLNSIG